MAQVTLNAIKGGINRLRIKGGPSPNNLYDALNCYIDASGAPQSRPGSVIDYTLPAGCRGLTAANGELVTFCHQVVSPIPPGVTLEVLPNPDDPADPIAYIHYAGPFLGDDTGVFLYVAAEFESGAVVHYWLQRADAWMADWVYSPTDRAQPTVANGLIYRPYRLDEPAELWAPDTEYTIGDVVEPSVFNGFKYELVEAYGTPPRSGTTEPVWTAEEGALVTEEADLGPGSGATQQQPSPIPPRYDNPGGSTLPGSVDGTSEQVR